MASQTAQSIGPFIDKWSALTLTRAVAGRRCDALRGRSVHRRHAVRVCERDPVWAAQLHRAHPPAPRTGCPSVSGSDA
eukprot:225346-Rhodomonas_salina.1